MKTTRQKTNNAASLMTAAFLLLALCLWLPAEVKAQQWTTNGNDINNTNTGNVGVGTTTPTNAKLQIDFNDGVASGEHGVLYGSRTGTGSAGFRFGYRADGTNPTGGFIRSLANLPFFIGTTGVPQALTLLDSGNIGIGTTNPTRLLELAAPSTNTFVYNSSAAALSIFNTNTTANNTADLSFRTFDSGGTAITPAKVVAVFTNRTVGASSGDLTFVTLNAGTAAERMRVTGTGKVGIGNPAPSFTLDVAGQVRSSSGGFVFPDNTTQATALAFGTAAGTAVQGNTTLTVAAGAGMSGGGTATLGGGGTLTLTNNDRGSSQNIFKSVGNAAGAAQFSAGSNADTLRFEGTGGTTVSFDAANRKVVINSASAGGQWTTSPSGTSISYSGGNVGIGTSTPLSGLTGNGGMELYVPSAIATFRIGTGLAGKNNAQVRFSGTSGDNWAIGSDVATHNGSRDFHFYDFAGTPDARLTIQSATGKVGVGTSNPATVLHVMTTGSTKPQFVLQNSTATTQIETSLAGNSAQWNYGMDQADGSKFKFSTDGSGNLAASTTLTMTTGGSVGIGTNMPAAKLDVYGGYMHVSGVCGGALPNVQGAYLSWNQICGTGETDLINHQGLGTGGFAFMNTTNGSALTTLMSISGNGDVTINGTINAKYQDMAEWVPSTQKLAAGTVVVLDGGKTNHVLASTSAYDTKVAGVISDSPGVILGVGGDDKLKVATTGRVKVKVDATRAPIKVGDLLVTSDVEGVAMKSVEVDLGGVKIHRPGTIIGKALETLEKGAGEILVLLSLQ